MSLNRVENLRRVGVPGFGSPGGPCSGSGACRPDPLEPLNPLDSTFSQFLPLILMSGAASIRLTAGFSSGEPMDATMWFLSLLLGLCVIGLFHALVRSLW